VQTNLIDAGAGTTTIQFVGHATVAIEMDGTRIMTDPVLRERAAGLVHRCLPPPAISKQRLDAVLISHLHHDHLDLASMHLLRPSFEVLVPRRAASFLARNGYPQARELAPGETVKVGNVAVTGTRADHRGYRVPRGPDADTIGFIVEGSLRIYFAGDTDLFDEMETFRPIDVALLPIAGWGPRLGPGHMDAERAVEALKLLQPRVAVPIHWGTLAPWGLHRGSWSYLTRPPRDFAAIAEREVPNVEVRVLQPGERWSAA